ncbi:MAG: hypothetical protein M3R65_02730 [Gemmatimonadota bacterium]|nr:hypothetical protein [Gemmatimonadota bacterium]
MRFKPAAIALSVALLASSACARNGSTGAGGAAVPQAVTTLTVDNQGSLDMDVFVTRSPVGQRIRLGTATANTTTRMVIPSDALLGTATSLRFIADPIGGTRRSVSSDILVNPGDTVTLQIPPS